jgi:hypothetical protein
MRRHIGWVFLLVGAFALRASPQSATCHRGQAEESFILGHASIFLTSGQTKVSLSQSMVINVGIRNDGKDPLYVYGNIAWGYGGGLVLRLRDQSGKGIKPVFLDDTMLPPPPQNDPSIFIRLKEDKFFGTRRELPIADLVKTPGKYSLQVEYRSPLPCGFVDPKLQRLPALWHEDASIFSNSISFEVVP